jgi:phosphoribosylanthranilate isomerase
MTRVKVCGITNCSDALIASQNGADAVGMVFYPPSPRAVSLAQACEIQQCLPPFVTTVALFVNETQANIERILSQCPIDLIQFHGEETESFCNKFNRPYIKAIRMKDGLDLYALQDEFHSAQGLLLDTYKKGLPGGTGESFNWDKVPPGLSKPLILAGGLQPRNVAEAITTVRPFAVDVSGGVESQRKGIKDPEKIRQFILTVRELG